MRQSSVVLLVIVLLLIITIYAWQETKDDQPVAIFSEGTEITKQPATKTPVLEYPEKTLPQTERDDRKQSPVATSLPVELPTVAKSKPLPELDESDDEIAVVVAELTNASKLFLFKSFIRHFVVTIDNMTNQKLPRRYTFTRQIPDKFSVIKQGANTTFLLDSKNYKRYASFVDLAEYVDSTSLVAYYAEFYDLFQQAYEELGYPDRDFTDRLIEVIEHLLATPDIRGHVYLIRPKVFYQFADPNLEALSAGQKILIRIGRDNAKRVKSRLRMLHKALLSFRQL